MAQVPRVVGYSRVSTEDQADKFSPEVQSRTFKTICEAKGWSLVKEYSDDESGTTWMDRAGLVEMLDDAEQGLFDLVLVADIDRFSRSQADLHYLVDKLRECGVKLADANTPDIDSSKKEFSLVGGVKGAVSEYFIKLLKERQRSGIDLAKEKGKHLGLPPHGFILNKQGFLEPDELGRRALQIIEVNPQIRAVVFQKEIGFEDYQRAWLLLKACKRYLSRGGV